MTTVDDRPLKLGVAIGFALVLLGVGAYVLTDFASITALIPAFFGILCVGLGQLGLNTDRDRIAVYGLGLLAVLGIGGSARAVGDIVALVSGESVDSAVAVAAQGGMIALCLVLLAGVAVALLGQR
ncbi:hypothetical protein [Natrononativus amylolyticus]|uniref:hypothetical protein n=1 Tax=Natrononativus amylolyticus TaxID=2963434 RepID=UPI0020CDD065|nr:hypothetical protein [Natrononativus amylolyticus]